MMEIENALSVASDLITVCFVAGFCTSCFLVLVVSAFEAVIRVFKKVAS